MVVSRKIVVLTMSLALLQGFDILWIVSLEVGVLNRNLLTRIALVAWMLLCALVSRNGGLMVLSRKIAVLTLSQVLLLGKQIWWILSLNVRVLKKKLLTSRALEGLILLCALVPRKGGLIRVKRILAATNLSWGLLPLVLLPGLVICVCLARRILLVVH